MTTLYEHPTFTANKPNWIKWRDLYLGDHTILTSSTDYFWPHAMETQSNEEAKSLLTSRKRRTRYLNIIEILVSLWTSYFFREEPQPDDEASILLDADGALENIDGYGTSLTSLIKDYLTPNYLLYGKPILLVDAYAIEAQNGQQEKELGVRPFIQVINPLDNPDWEIEATDPARIGRYNLFRYEFLQFIPRTSATQEPQTKLCSYSLEKTGTNYVVKKYYATLDKQGNVNEQFRDKETSRINWLSEGETAVDLSELPVVGITRDSWIKDAAEETLRHFNLRSNLDNVNYFQGYDTKFIVGVNPSDAASYRAMTEYSAVFLPEGAQPIKLPANDPLALERATADAISTAFKVGLNQLRALPGDSRQVQGADTQLEDKDNQYALVESSIDELENLTNQALQHYAAFKGVDNFQGTIEFNKEITKEDTQQFLEIWAATRDELIRVNGVRKAIVKKLISKLELENEDELLEMADKLPDKDEQMSETLRPRLGLVSKALNGGEQRIS